MIAIITGDVINSRSTDTENWINELKSLLSHFGDEPKTWQIFRGDSFQLELEKPDEAIKAAFYLKAGIKSISQLDIRMAIGIGDKSYDADFITQANGSAFIHSGACFEQLKKRRLAVKSSNESLDEEMNLLLDLASLTMNQWTPVVASTIKALIENPSVKRKDLAKQLDKSQSTVSENLQRGGYEEIMRIGKRYKKLVGALC